LNKKIEFEFFKMDIFQELLRFTDIPANFQQYANLDIEILGWSISNRESISGLPMTRRYYNWILKIYEARIHGNLINEDCFRPPAECQTDDETDETESESEDDQDDDDENNIDDEDDNEGDDDEGDEGNDSNDDGDFQLGDEDQNIPEWEFEWEFENFFLFNNSFNNYYTNYNNYYTNNSDQIEEPLIYDRPEPASFIKQELK